ncbi:hypothetical protein N665_0655s0007 [Sinapis alba]|nr:hypothetical protein N665_0655s0007 [Sinapis alba]
MATTGRSRSSSVLCPLSSSTPLLNHHRRSSSLCNINLRLKRFSPRNTPKPSAASKCLCSPTTHPGSFRCAFHRRLETEKNRTLNSQAKKLNKFGNTTSSSGLNLRKTVLVNSLARIASVEAERFRLSLAASMVKPSSLRIDRRFDFRPRPSRFYALRKDQDLISRFCRL